MQVRTNVQRSLAMELSQLSMEFRKQQKAYLAKMKQTKEGVAMGVDPLDQQGQKWQWSDEEEDAGMSSGQV
jgi:syntaxin 16